MDAQPGRHVQRLAGVAHALQAAVALRGGLPAVEAADVEVPVAGVEPPAADAGQELHAQIDRAGLPHVADLSASSRANSLQRP